MASVRSAESRKSRTDAKVLAATLALLRTSGPAAVTVEAVASRSGVAKTTIYRRHADRRALLEAALDRVPPIEASAAADPCEELRALVAGLVAVVERYIGPSVVSALAQQGDAASRAVEDRVIAPRVEVLTSWLMARQATGELREDLDAHLTVATVLGSMAYCYARDGSLRDGWSDRLVDHLWPALRAEGSDDDLPCASSGRSPIAGSGRNDRGVDRG